MVVYRQKFRLQLGGIVVQDSRVVYFRKESHAIIRLKVFRFLSRETHGLGDLFLAHEGTEFRRPSSRYHFLLWDPPHRDSGFCNFIGMSSIAHLDFF